jgi:hypothetical protein
LSFSRTQDTDLDAGWYIAAVEVKKQDDASEKKQYYTQTIMAVRCQVSGWQQAVKVLSQGLEIQSFLDEALCRHNNILRIFSQKAKNCQFSLAITERVINF